MKVYVLGKKSIVAFSVFVVVVICAVFFSFTGIGEEVVAVSKAKKKLPIYCVGTDQNIVSVSFDAAWGADDTDNLLEILAKHNIKTTFFLVGGWVEKYPEQVKKIHAAGHDIGNHSNKHPDMAKLSREQIKNELMDAHKKVKDLLGIDMNLFRPPFGSYNDAVLDVAKDCGYYTVQWDVDSLDWKEKGKQHMIDRVLQNKALGQGSIILFHNNAKYTKDTLDTILTGLEDKGFKVIPISEILLKDDYYMDHTGRQIKNGEGEKAE